MLFCFLMQRETSSRLQLVNHKKIRCLNFQFLLFCLTSVVKLRLSLGPPQAWENVLYGSLRAAAPRSSQRVGEVLAEKIRADGGICEPIGIDMKSLESIRAVLV